MKKLIVAMAVACVAVFAHGAACTWSSSGVNSAGDDMLYSGTYWTVMLGADAGASANFIVYDNGTYNFGGYSVIDTGNTFTTEGGFGGKFTGLTSADNGKYFAVVLWDGNDYFGVAEASIKGIVDASQGAPKDADLVTLSNIGEGCLQVNTPVEAVPEPTSGLLMLLGMAGLALRRRRA